MIEENIIQNFLEGYYGFECTLASPHPNFISKGEWF